MTKRKKTVYQLAEEHWIYSSQLIKILQSKGKAEELLFINILGHFLYTEAFVHGYKHAKEKK